MDAARDFLVYSEQDLRRARQSSILELLPKGSRVRSVGKDRWKTNCPFHDDRTPSFSILRFPDGNWRYKCFGCGKRGDPVTFVQEQNGLDFQDAVQKLTGISSRKAPTMQETATYDYRNENGEFLYQVVRYEPKTFRQRTKLTGFENDKVKYNLWSWDLSGIRRVPYRLQELTLLPFGSRIYWVEGEKDVDRLVTQGVQASTNSGGTNGFRSEFAALLEGFEIVVIPDQDDPGLAYGRDVFRAFQKTAYRIGFIELPAGCKDVSDYFDAGGTVAGLERMIQWEKT